MLSVASMREPTNCDLERLRDVSNREPLSRGPNDERDMRNAQAFFLARLGSKVGELGWLA